MAIGQCQIFARLKTHYFRIRYDSFRFDFDSDFAVDFTVDFVFRAVWA